MKSYLKKLKAKMPAAPGKEAEDQDDMLELDLEEGESLEAEHEEAESPEHEAAESAEFEAGEHEELGEMGAGLPEGTPEEEAMETEEAHTAELSDEALLAELKKRGLMKGGAPKKAVAVSKDMDEDTGY